MSKLIDAVSELLIDYRKKHNLDRKQLSALTGIEESVLRRWELKMVKGMHETSIERVEQFFGVELPVKEYALYKGEELIEIGRLSDIAKVTGNKIKSLKWRLTPLGKERLNKRKWENVYYLIKLEDD